VRITKHGKDMIPTIANGHRNWIFNTNTPIFKIGKKYFMISIALIYNGNTSKINLRRPSAKENLSGRTN